MTVPTRRLHRPLTAAATSVLTVLVATVLPAVPAGTAAGSASDAGAATAAPLTQERYAALGDSSAAGPIIVPQRPGAPSPCYRSAVNFPSLVAAALGTSGAAFADATCSSAETIHAFETQGQNPPQLDAVDGRTTLVSVGPIGANDAGIVSAVVRCLVPGCAQREGDEMRAAVAAVRPGVRRVLAAVRREAPRAAVVVVGYGRYVPPGACPLTQPLTVADATYVQDLIDRLNGILAGEARRAGATFTDLGATPGALDHTACAPPGRRWLEGLVPLSGDGAVPFHPTALGMRAFAGQVVRAAGQARNEQLRAARASLSVGQRCVRGRPRLTVRGGLGLVDRVGFRTAGTTRRVDVAAPYRWRVRGPVTRRAVVRVRLVRPGAGSLRVLRPVLRRCR
ncbi:SGNH/GDSL hydrolase family protein [Nocardioides sp. SYSU D00038]|uniref:SGNH/GDSL hydrolase family protein n=1 Tax=Nocardioides sp. SYSU D00038 TaxID=2812554 RepID=UPI001967CB91|nr:SGNH/GDSL hydrolase family protein [Nocardioides sp. SYSU D00038]